MQISGSTITIPAIKLPGGLMSQSQVLDLTLFQGGSVRVYVDDSGNVCVNPHHDCYCLMYEMNLPPAGTDTVQQGTIANILRKEKTITRGAAQTDTVLLAVNESMGRVGFVWHPYLSPDDYSEAGGVITWVVGHGPQTDDTFNVEIIKSMNEPNMISQPVALDLSAIKITAFAAPK